MGAQNAILTKARAMFAGRLQSNNYTEMLQCKSVRDVATYLKTKTSYEKFFQNLNTSSIHRGWLEVNLKNVLTCEYEALSHYDYALGDTFYEFFITEEEIKQLVRCVTLINSGISEKYYLSLPPFFNNKAVLNLDMLAKATNFSDFLKVIENTPYFNVCSKFIDKGSENIDILSLSKALDQYMFEKINALISNNAKGKEKKELEKYLKMRADLYNVNVLYRTGILNTAGVTIEGRSLIMPFGSLNERTLTQFDKAEDNAKFVEVLRGTSYGKYLSSDKYDYIELATRDILYNTVIHLLRFSPHPLVVMLCYESLFEIEIENIIHIIEGIRYNVEVDEISQILIGYSK